MMATLVGLTQIQQLTSSADPSLLKRRVIITDLIKSVDCYSDVITCYSDVITSYSDVITCYRHVITCYSDVITCYSHIITCYRNVITCYSDVITKHKTSLQLNHCVNQNPLVCNYV